MPTERGYTPRACCACAAKVPFESFGTTARGWCFLRAQDAWICPSCVAEIVEGWHGRWGLEVAAEVRKKEDEARGGERQEAYTQHFSGKA